MLNKNVEQVYRDMKQNKEQEILKAAEDLFAEKGFKGATTTLIASRAGVTHAMLHYYYRTKEQIFLKVFDRYVEEMRQALKAIMVPDLYDMNMIAKVTEIVFAFFNEHRGQVTLFLEVARERPDLLETYASELGRLLGTAMSAHRERTERAIREGRIRPISFETLLLDIVSVCASSLLFDPVLDNMLGMDAESKARFLDARRKEAVELIVGRLEVK